MLDAVAMAESTGHNSLGVGVDTPCPAPLNRLLYALVRPCELIALKVSDFLVGSETGCSNVIFIKLQLIKSRTR